jgi:hypothetical protein
MSNKPNKEFDYLFTPSREVETFLYGRIDQECIDRWTSKIAYGQIPDHLPPNIPRTPCIIWNQGKRMQVRLRKDTKLNVRELIYVMRKGNPIEYTNIITMCNTKNCIEPMHLKCEPGKRSGRKPAKQIISSVQALQTNSWLQWHYQEPEVVDVALQIRTSRQSPEMKRLKISNDLRQQLTGEGYGHKYISPIMDFENVLEMHYPPQKSNLLGQKAVRDARRKKMEEAKLHPPPPEEPPSLISTILQNHESNAKANLNYLFSEGGSDAKNILQTEQVIIPGSEEDNYRTMFHMERMQNGGGEMEDEMMIAKAKKKQEAHKKIQEIIIKYIKPPKSQDQIEKEKLASNQEKDWNEMMQIRPMDQNTLAPWIKRRNYARIQNEDVSIVRMVMPANKYRKVTTIKLDEIIQVIKDKQMLNMKTMITDIKQSGNTILMMIMEKELSEESKREFKIQIRSQKEGEDAVVLEVAEEDAQQLMELLEEVEESEEEDEAVVVEEDLNPQKTTKEEMLKSGYLVFPMRRTDLHKLIEKNPMEEVFSGISTMPMKPPDYRRIVKDALVDHLASNQEILQDDPADRRKKRIRPKDLEMIRDLEGITGCSLAKEVIKKRKKLSMEERGGNMMRMNQEQRLYNRKPARRMGLYEPNAALLISSSLTGSQPL